MAFKNKFDDGKSSGSHFHFKTFHVTLRIAVEAEKRSRDFQIPFVA